jgi:hypothetical protein
MSRLVLLDVFSIDASSIEWRHRPELWHPDAPL